MVYFTRAKEVCGEEERDKLLREGWVILAANKVTDPVVYSFVYCMGWPEEVSAEFTFTSRNE